MNERSESGRVVQSSIGEVRLDDTGTAIGATRIDPANGYRDIPLILQEYIDNGSDNAWREIQKKIDNIYVAVSSALEALEAEEPFSGDILSLLENGKKLCLKPNLVELPLIDPRTHGPVLIGTATPWEFVASVMRWFHDKCGVSYHQMIVGEAGTAASRTAYTITKVLGGNVFTTQAVLEGKNGDDYGGWGFYFARKYLSECHDPNHEDDPLKGYEESLKGVCLPPGEINDRLLVYDLNKISDDMSDGRDVPVADGINFKTITMHKAIVGGDPTNAEDTRKWPGCVLINVCKLKVHTRELFTCAIKNLGIGLYPMEMNTSHDPDKFRWKYAVPNLKIPMVKMAVPHARWIAKFDEETGAPIRNIDGSYVFTETGGLEASIADAVQAITGQGIKILHIVDAIETANISHIGPSCTPLPEGLVFAGTDMVAMDVCTSRFLLNMVAMKDSEEIQKEHNLNSDVIQKVPMPKLDGKNIVNGEGYDSSYSRSSTIKYCENRGLGRQNYHIVGNDLNQGGTLASLNGRLGRVDNGMFVELLTNTLYHAVNKPLWDLQKTCMTYLDLNDKLTGSDFKQKVREAYDENNDGVIDYMESGKGDSLFLMSYGMSLMTQNLDPAEELKLRFLLSITPLKYLKKEWNRDGHHLGEELILGQALTTAYAMSNATEEADDSIIPGMTWGKGKWPSMQFAIYRYLSSRIYGQKFPGSIDGMSPYGNAFNYADARWNGGKYSKPVDSSDWRDPIADYRQDVAKGADLLPFTFYVPKGFGNIDNQCIPNVEETDNPDLMFTARFNGTESWQDLRLSSFNLI